MMQAQTVISTQFPAVHPIVRIPGPLHDALPALSVAMAPLNAYGTRVRFAAGETIFNEGDVATKTYRVLCGAVRLCKHMSDGRRQIVEFILAGDFFGLMQLPEYAFTAEAVNDVVVVSYPRPQIERLGGASCGFRNELFALLSTQLLGMHQHLVMVGRQSAKERVAGFLLKLVNRADASDGDTLELPMSRQDMADYLGLTIETVCRELSALKKARVLSAPDLHSIAVHDVVRLETIASGE